ncbi:hypothetical protein AMAG_17512 [Allomyces macrogynus ATCC 38327]|uniref:Uncharacterized protein n=1 Tax=Allomyces macrogynus (strain ATCC 38327) TaxID=578462 RepID=A0A0L0TFB3_ALLM3|nr:hypothetical protein AMAG_17512 [Allomyces macrogynus ATCC 38327]|eukprot:KNE73361.1 hypothetical protein AMAG_17512 [Allomyces macrogynus ATCC 38327]
MSDSAPDDEPAAAATAHAPLRSTRTPIPAFPLEPWPTAAKNTSAAHLLLRCPSPEQIEAMIMAADDRGANDDHGGSGAEVEQDVANAVAAEEEGVSADGDRVPVGALKHEAAVKRDEPMPAVATGGRFQLGSKVGATGSIGLWNCSRRIGR